MGKHNAGRLVAILLSVVVYGVSLVFNGLSVMGVGPFSTTTGNVSDVFVTEITPSGWTFSIWSVIYVWLTLMIIYILANLCRKNIYGYVYCSPPVLPYGFFICWCLNLCFNIAWLLVWDRAWMIAALVFLILVAGTNYGMISFACHGLHVYGAWLKEYHKVDLWLIRILVQNGVMIYTTWTTIATLINLAIVLTYEANISPTNAATVSYCILTIMLLVWFFLQNVVLDKHMRYVLIDYPVVIWALTGNFDKNYNAESPSRSGIFIVVLLAAASLLYAVRLVLVIWRHCKQPLYNGVSPQAVEPMEPANHQKWALR
ncbi:uncharacterized protein LOC109516984 [Hippocampus comes]|uniref:uncharacterized protein LOC109516984 n=1 Tax=Hippocampus comes TaxID=109280 RepID=UPI00094E75C9|nr:PREDICTED: uncharacterized protein LOC109516984 [Hippocampus comes]XP_019727395.1 PREDICTED: uncharacterized protein LOC109516984 [Hippocampus comes]